LIYLIIFNDKPIKTIYNNKKTGSSHIDIIKIIKYFRIEHFRLFIFV